MAKDLAIILNNGSLNSAVVTALAVQRYRPILIYAEIAQAAGSRRRAAYDQQVAHFKPYREHTLAMPFLQPVQSTGSAQAATADPRQSGLLAPALIDLLPLISAAVSFAAHYDAASIYAGLRIGSTAEELVQGTEYIQILNELIQLPCGRGDMELITPLMELDPWQVVEVGYQVNAPFDRTWSCMEQMADPCGICRGCRSREAAFQQAAKPDPLRPVSRPSSSGPGAR